MKLVIGSAQFGSNYGLSNKVGELKTNEIKKILNFANKVGIREIDTAIGYGNSEKKLGKVITPDKWKAGARNTVESGMGKLGANKLLGKKKRKFF